MTERLNEKLKVARITLQKLSEGPIRWTPLVKAIIKESPSPWKVQSILEWLLIHGYVERPERGLYCITEKGFNLLQTLC